MHFSSLLGNSQVVAIVCNQWGDTGKGKFAEYFAVHWADVIARGTGGNNAGHTVVVNGKQRIFHLLPAGIVHDGDGKINVLGDGMAIDLGVVCQELDELDREGLPHDNLIISENALVVMPYHVQRDRASFESLKAGGIGSTGKGIGPCYTDKVARRGIFVRDLLDTPQLKRKIEQVAPWYPEDPIDADRIVAQLRPHVERIAPYVKDAGHEVRKLHRQGKRILLEGAQGLLLSIDYGTYPYVTSCDSSINGTAQGVGLSPRDVDLTLGAVKFPYMTRVGAGPFPTELGGKQSEEHCARGLEHDVRFELEQAGVPYRETKGRIEYDTRHANIRELMNSGDPFRQGIGVRLSGAEYGATTGRPRRVGWTDLVALKYAVAINGPDVVLTKVDVLQGASEIKLGVGRDSADRFRPNAEALQHARHEYRSFPGYGEDLSQIAGYADLPGSLRDAIDFLESFTGARVRMVSIGAEREQVLVK